MPMLYAVAIRQDDNGGVKTTKGGHLQFSLKLFSEDKKPLLTVHGFRVDKQFERILPPISFAKGNVVNIVELTRACEDQFLALLQKQYEAL